MLTGIREGEDFGSDFRSDGLEVDGTGFRGTAVPDAGVDRRFGRVGFGDAVPLEGTGLERDGRGFWGISGGLEIRQASRLGIRCDKSVPAFLIRANGFAESARVGSDVRTMPRRLLLGLLTLLLLVGVLLWRRSGGSRPESGRTTPDRAAEEAARKYLDLEAREQAAESTLWSPEREAARHEDELWRWVDAVQQSTNRWQALAGLPITGMSWPGWRSDGVLPDGTEMASPTAPAPDAASTGWSERCAGWAAEGWRVAHVSAALVGHGPGPVLLRDESWVDLMVFAERASSLDRVDLRLRVRIRWQAGQGGVPVLSAARVVSGHRLHRRGPTPFGLELESAIPTERSLFPDPLLAWDIDGDGISELILVGADRLWRRVPDGAGSHVWRSQPWMGLPVERITAAVRADLQGDGVDDLVVASAAGVAWWPGEAGKGPQPGKPVVGWTAPAPMKHPQAVTAGDADGDGDLDLWIIQYKLPYQAGQFPTPWDDANDGFPSYFLRNEGSGRFVDDTEAVGLAAKRFRRSYSASWIDLDLDGDLDLVNVSDFAGLDVYRNDGGRFTDVTEAQGESRHAFGMSHTVGDLDGDGLPDLLMLGMTSAVGDRLLASGVERGGSSIQRVAAMVHGNRLFWGAASPALLRPAPGGWATAVARTGWSWGAAWSDLDLDGRLDLAVVTGHETRASVRDYERQFWWHDRFVAGSGPDAAALLYFRTAAGRRQADRASYGGWQANGILVNQGERPWPDLAWVWGLAEIADCRNLLVEDVDRDGRPDLVVTTQEEWPVKRQRLLVYRNRFPPGNWAGFRWPGPYPSGARFTLETTRGRMSRWLLTGDGFRSQNEAAVHFGLGGGEPRALTVQIPGAGTFRWESGAGRVWRLLEPGPSR